MTNIDLGKLQIRICSIKTNRISKRRRGVLILHMSVGQAYKPRYGESQHSDKPNTQILVHVWGERHEARGTRHLFNWLCITRVEKTHVPCAVTQYRACGNGWFLLGEEHHLNLSCCSDVVENLNSMRGVGWVVKTTRY